MDILLCWTPLQLTTEPHRSIVTCEMWWQTLYILYNQGCNNEMAWCYSSQVEKYKIQNSKQVAELRSGKLAAQCTMDVVVDCNITQLVSVVCTKCFLSLSTFWQPGTMMTELIKMRLFQWNVTLSIVIMGLWGFPPLMYIWKSVKPVFYTVCAWYSHWRSTVF